MIKEHLFQFLIGYNNYICTVLKLPITTSPHVIIGGARVYDDIFDEISAGIQLAVCTVISCQVVTISACIW